MAPDRRRLWALVAGVIAAITITIAAVGTSAEPVPEAVPQRTPAGMLLPGTGLPTGTECAARVRGGGHETRPANAAANGRTGGGARVPEWTPDGYAPEFNREILPRIDGDYTGTTDQILQWAACKWGLPPDLLRAMAVEESNWRQSMTGDLSSDPGDCVARDEPPCPTSFGLMQVKHLFRPGSYPLSAQSTAFNVDYAVGVVRGCYEGWVTYLGPDARGDLWGCAGWHFSGEWRDSSALGYVARVGQALDEAPWTHW